LEFKEKKSILTDIFKIRRFRRSDYCVEDKTLPCPISRCGLVAREANELRVHLYTCHKELSKYGIKVDG
jgi:hypothetical protein